MTEQEILHGPFNADVHAKTFINYLEVVISPSGIIEYAVPSHMEKVILAGMDKAGIEDREQFVMDYCLIHNIYGIDELCDYTGFIAVWNNYYIGKPNRFQQHALEELKRRGLYYG